MKDQKAALRTAFRQLRDALDPALRTTHDRAILVKLKALPELLAARSVFCYVSAGSEADTHALLDWLAGVGKQASVPSVAGNDEMIAAKFDGWSALEPGRFGILAPASPVPHAGPVDVCITPCLAFTEDGKRLGQGRGYYDRWLAAHRVHCRIAPAYECQLAAELPADKHDVTVDIIVTERRIIRVS